MTREKFAALLICLLTVTAFTQIRAQQIIDGFQAPESIIKHGDKLFVSNIGGTQPNPAAKDGDGFISELSADGKIVQQKFQKSMLNAPKGSAIIGNVIYVADIDRVVGFDISSGEQVFELNIEGAAFLNDLCKIDDATIAVSDSFNGKVFRVNVQNKTYTVAGHAAGANGVIYDAGTKKLFVCTMGEQMSGHGKLYAKDINNKDTIFTELPDSPEGIFDGIGFMDNDHLIVSDWVTFDANNTKARLLIYDLKNHSTVILPFEQSPADISYDKASRKVYIPQMQKNRIVIADIDSFKKQ